jgi:phosphoribosylglycinamide formyltransferase-1
VPIETDDDDATLAARALQMEHRIYPEAARLFAADRLELRNGHALLDGEQLLEPIQFDRNV